ncbi:hypothetical protein BKA64DRAFT_728156, partial [Cadophora sp. MPI-SDFR-AT-0126]
MDAPWHRTWPEMGKLHVFGPEGDVLLILERFQEDDLEEPAPSAPLSADAPDWPEPEPNVGSVTNLMVSIGIGPTADLVVFIGVVAAADLVAFIGVVTVTNLMVSIGIG